MSATVLVADDQPLMRAALVALIDAADDLKCVGEAADGQSAVRLARAVRPDLVLLDIVMDGPDGLDAAERLVMMQPAPRVVMLTTFDDDEYLNRALTAGASGFLLKNLSPEDLLSGIRVALGGHAVLAPELTTRVVSRYADSLQGQSTLLPLGISDLERQLLRLVGEGLDNTQIAERVFLSPATVKTYLGRLMNKVNVSNRAQLVALAYRARLV